MQESAISSICNTLNIVLRFFIVIVILLSFLYYVVSSEKFSKCLVVCENIISAK